MKILKIFKQKEKETDKVNQREKSNKTNQYEKTTKENKTNQEEKANKENQVKKTKVIKEDSEKVKNIKFHILAIVAVILFSAAICPVSLQNDTFYTIRIGEHILNTKTVDMVDPFSWHENLPYTYPHWAYDVFIYLIFSLGGFKAIFASTVVLSCILGVLVYITNCKISKNKLISFMITLGAMYLMRYYIAARAQLVTFILLELTILFIEKFLEKKKVGYAVGLILISIAIANLHCAVWPFFFVLFLPYVAEYLLFTVIDSNFIYKARQKYYDLKIKLYTKKNNTEKINKAIAKKEELAKNNEKLLANREKRREKPYKIRYEKNKATKWLILIMIICAFTGLLTPLGDTPYTYLYKTMKGNTTQSISEHLPLTLINNKEMLVVIVAILAILIFTDTKFRAKDLFMLAGLCLLMFMTRRQESMFVLFGSAIVAKIITDLFTKYDKGGSKEVENIMISTLGIIATILVVVLMSVVEFKPKINDEFIKKSSYPVDAAEYIKNNIDMSSMRLFNEYNYGSYLLYEGIPVFVDSRADLYAPEFNGTRKEDGTYEGRDIFSDYINTSSLARYYEKTFEKYEITHVILYKNSKLNVYISKDKNYEELYSDDSFVIYKRNV